MWKDWPHQISKVDLAKELWPILERRIVSGRGRATPVANVVAEAINLAQEARRVRVFEVRDT